MAEEARGGLYRWLDRVPLSRPRRNLTRDFSDGVLAAELVRFHFPALVQLHSFIPASATAQKLSNWGHLNRKVLPKLNFSIPEEVIQEIVQCRPGTVEQVLILLRQKIEEKQKEKRSKKAAGPGQVAPSQGSEEAAPWGLLEVLGGPRAPMAAPRLLQKMPPSASSSRRGSRRWSWRRRPSRSCSST
ncbi:sperm flagellar protein 1 isoform X2 [Cuculus canorus]|uniref:sperm flagellar protein 1 isoform X2 n=1 Tax=Cuculus canorus TaxID=55661 RepID=UPI0023AA9ABF|nr:sperm flagellar protein 1 isoform X2 [Cuculus canorus]